MCLSRKFAEVYAKSFDCIVFLRYDEKHASMVDLLLEKINIANYDEDRNSSESEKRKQRLKKIQELLTPETLIILDNYDVETPASELLDMFDWNAKWLVTTRSDFSYLGGQTAQIQVGQMAFPELLEIFQQESHQPVPSEQSSALGRLFAQFDNYTMVVTLLAKQVYAAGITIEEICGTDDVYEYDERLVSAKDAVVTQDTLLGHLQRMFNMAGLTDEQQETLRTVWMMQDANEITKQFFKKYSGLSLNGLNSLISLGWLQYADHAVSLHPVIKQLVERILHPTCQNCPHLYQTFLQRLSALRTAIDQNDSNAFSGETENLFRVYAYYMFATDERADENLLTLSLCLLDLYEQYEAPEFMWFIGWENQEYFFPSILRALSLAKSEEPEENMILEEKKLWYQPLTLHIANLGCNFCRMQFENLKDVESSSEDVLDNTVAVYSALLWAIICYDHKTQQSAHHHVQRQVDQIIEIDNPTRKFSDSIFMKECSICENGDYHDWIECDYSRGISPHRNEWHWNFYVVLYMALSLCFEAYPKEERHTKRYQEYGQALNRMNAEILRAGVGYDHFYDFYNLSQERANKLSKSAIKWDTDKHFTHSNLNYFDENNTHAYFSEVIDTLQRTKQPYYLYRLLLNDDFRISDELKCLLIEWDMAKHIAEDPRLTNAQKRRLAVFAVENVVPEGDFDSKRSILQRHCIDGILQNDTVPQKTKYGIYNAVANNFVSKVGEYYYEVITDGGTLPVDHLFHQYYPIHKHTPNTVALFADSIYQHINGWPVAISGSTAITAQMNYLSHTSIPHLCRTEAIYTHIQFSDALGGEEGFRTIMDKVVPVAFRYLMLPEHFDPGLVLSMVDIIKETEYYTVSNVLAPESANPSRDPPSIPTLHLCAHYRFRFPRDIGNEGILPPR